MEINEKISRLDYYIAHAPSVPEWFEPIRAPKIRGTSIDDFIVDHQYRELIKDHVEIREDNTIIFNDLPSQYKEFIPYITNFLKSAIIEAEKNKKEMEIYKSRKLDQLMNWQIGYARTVVASLETSLETSGMQNEEKPIKEKDPILFVKHGI